MRPDPDLIVILSSVTVMVTVVSIARLVGRWIDRRAQLPRADESDDRLARIEQAVDAISIEVERISEGQRFTTRLLAEKNGAKAPDVTPTRSSQAASS